MKRKILTVLSVLIFSGALPLFALPAAPESNSDPAEVRRVLTDLEKKMSGIETMQTKFSQKKKLSLFQHEVVISGSLFMEKPGRFAWYTELPVRYSIVLDKGKIYQWDEDTNRVQVLSFSAMPVLKMVIEQMQTWFSGSYLSLTEQYDIKVLSSDPLSLKFSPHQDAVSAPVIKSVTVQFRRDQAYIESILIEEVSGDESTLNFTDTMLNSGINPSVWEIKSRAA